MLRSMTGFGKADGESDGDVISVELTAVNHRYLDISLRMSRSLYSLEQNIRKKVSSIILRGKVEISIQLEHTGEDSLSLSLNTQQASRISELVRSLQQTAGCTNELDTASLLMFKDILFEWIANPIIVLTGICPDLLIRA